MEEEKTTLLDAINAAHLRRKYYLNSRVKDFASVSSRQRSISIPAGLDDQLSIKQREYLNELVSNYGYSPQYCIPDNKKL